MGLLLSVLTWLEAHLPNITITVKAKPYLTRAYFFLKDRAWGNLYLHHFRSSDQGDQLHNHPWAWGLSIVLFGGYSEERASNPVTWETNGIPSPVPIERRNIRPGRINVIRPTDFHRVDLYNEEKGAWTLFFAGPRIKSWGFLDRRTSEFTDWQKNPEAIA